MIQNFGKELIALPVTICIGINGAACYKKCFLGKGKKYYKTRRQVTV